VRISGKERPPPPFLSLFPHTRANAAADSAASGSKSVCGERRGGLKTKGERPKVKAASSSSSMSKEEGARVKYVSNNTEIEWRRRKEWEGEKVEEGWFETLAHSFSLVTSFMRDSQANFKIKNCSFKEKIIKL
jgi:hypothetical protein